jgi:hypothetical protein
MERHIAGLVQHLKDGTDNRSGFAKAVEDTMAHAFWLESECDRLRKENRELDDALHVGMVPTIAAGWRDMPPLAPSPLHTFDWYVEPIRWRGMFRPFQEQADEKNWLRIRRSAFRGAIKRLRDQFEKTFPTRPSFDAQ